MKKLDHKWAGPFTITKVVSPAAIKLCLSTQEKNIHPVISVSTVHSYIPDDIVSCLQPLQPAPITVADQKEYKVKEIFDSRFSCAKQCSLPHFVRSPHFTT